MQKCMHEGGKGLCVDYKQVHNIHCFTNHQDVDFCKMTSAEQHGRKTVTDSLEMQMHWIVKQGLRGRDMSSNEE